MTLTHFAQDDPVEIEPNQSELDDQETDSLSAGYEIMAYPTHYTLQTVYEKLKSGRIALPDFQRRYTWTMSKASRLIESFLIGLPVPGIFLYRERDSEREVVIDGQHRLMTAFFYMGGEFADGREFRLTKNVHRDWRGRAYQDLEEDDQMRIEDSVLRATVIKQFNPHGDTSMFHIFERLNTAGTPLSAQEIRNCLYPGKFNDMLKDVNEHCEAWRAILGADKPSPRQTDVELALRMFALWLNSDEYKEPMKDFLNVVMESRRNEREETLQKFRNAFDRTCRVIVYNLGEKPFHIRSGLNAAAFDSVAVAFARNIDQLPAGLAEKYEMLKADADFVDATCGDAASASSVRKRLAVAENVLFGNGLGCE